MWIKAELFVNFHLVNPESLGCTSAIYIICLTGTTCFILLIIGKSLSLTSSETQSYCYLGRNKSSARTYHMIKIVSGCSILALVLGVTYERNTHIS